MTIAKKIERIKMLTDAAFEHADPNHPSCYGCQITPDNPHPLCLECGFLEMCKVEGQSRLAEAGQVVEDELAALESIAQLEQEFASYTTLTTPVVEPEPEPVIELPEPIVEPEPVIEIEIEVESDTADDDPDQHLPPISEEQAAAEPEPKAMAAKTNALAGFDWPGLINNLMAEKPATYRAAAKMMRAEFKAFGFAPKYSSHSGHYINKVLKGLADKGALTMNVDKTITWI